MGSILVFFASIFLKKKIFGTVFRFKGHPQNKVMSIMQMFDRLFEPSFILFQLFALNVNFQHCLGLVDVLLANQHAEMLARMLLFIY